MADHGSVAGTCREEGRAQGTDPRISVDVEAGIGTARSATQIKRDVTAARVLLLLSGATALVFQTLWVKQITLVVGIEVRAVAVVVAAFFAGLAAGAAVFGKLIDLRRRRPLVWYAALEALVALVGVSTTLVLPYTPTVFAALEQRAAAIAWLLPTMLVAVPAFFMGGTLPVAMKWTRPMEAGLGHTAGNLYAWNTAGAIGGALLGPFMLLPYFGVRGTGIAAAVVCALTATVAWRLGREPAVQRSRMTGDVNPAQPSVRVSKAPQTALALMLYACAGAVALGYEVLWSQIVAPFTSTRGAAFALVLVVYLTGLAVGSALWARQADRVPDRWVAFGLLIAMSGLAALASFAALGPWLSHLQEVFGTAVAGVTASHALGMYARFLLAAIVIVLPATVLLGAAFPAAVRLTGDADVAGQSIGRVTAWNTVGAVAGTVLVGFVAVPRLGLAITLIVLAVLSCLIGVAAVLASSAPGRRPALIAGAALAGCLVTAVLLPRDKLGRLLAELEGGALTFYQEGAGGSVAVLQQSTRAGDFRRLYIAGVSNSGDSIASLRYMRLQALLPLVIHDGEPRRALVIALGTGITCGSLLADPDLVERVCVELLPEVVAATSQFRGNFGAPRDARIDLRIADGRHELLRSDEQWDLVTLEPPPPSAAGVVNLYSREFYQLVRSRLAPDGMLAQWWPLPTQNLEDSRALVRSFIEAFPHVTLWSTEVHEMMLLGSMHPITLDVPRIRARFERPGVAAALAEVGIDSPAALLATWVTDRDGLVAFVGDSAPVTDDRPRIEVAPWLRPGEMARVLPTVLDVTTDPPLLGADAEFVAAVDRNRGELGLLFQSLQASLEGEREREAESLWRLRRAAPDNPYYYWIAPGKVP
jgi:predicted membrane-bound spermidine synthase